MWGQVQGSKVLSLDSGQSDLILRGQSFAAATFQATGGSSGRLLLSDQVAGIRAAPFDVAHPVPTSADTSVLTNVNYEVETESVGWLAVSNTGTAVYATGNPSRASLVWVDREGRIASLGTDQEKYREASLSPDGQKAVVRNGLDLWIHDLQRGTRSRLTSGTGSNILPLWSRDGTRIVFASNRGGDWDIYTQPADGALPAEALLKRPHDQFPLALLTDGTLLYTEIDPKTGRDLWTLSPDGKASPLRVTPYNETAGQFSPGPAGSPRWLAYSSDESGRSEIYVQSYPSGANRIPVSTEGGDPAHVVARWQGTVLCDRRRGRGRAAAAGWVLRRASTAVRPIDRAVQSPIPQLQRLARRQTVPHDSARSGIGAAPAQRDSQLDWRDRPAMSVAAGTRLGVYEITARSAPAVWARSIARAIRS